MKNNKIKSANGISGYILKSFNNNYFFRLYNKDGTFTDYDINHSDLHVIIDDEDARFYENTNTNTNILDHSPTTLGIKIVE